MSNNIKIELQKIQIPSELKNRGKRGVQQAKQETNRNVHFNFRQLSGVAIIGLILVSTAFFHTEVVAAVKKVLQFVPGIGIVHEGDIPTERYILAKPVIKEFGRGSITITGIVVEEEMTLINVSGKDTPRLGQLKLVGDNGKEYVIKDTQSIWSPNEWSASYWHQGKLNITERANIIFDGKQEMIIPITLEKAKTYESYSEMGEVSTVNGVKITAIPQTLSDKVRISLVSQHTKDFRITDYGLLGMYAREDKMLSINDDTGNQYKFELMPGLTAPTSEFLFPISENKVEKYMITIPEINVEYADEVKTTIEVPETELQLNKTFSLAGFPFELTKIERLDNRNIRVYVDVKFDEQDKKSLHNFSMMNESHMARVSDTTGELLYLEFEIEAGSKKVDVTFGNPQVILRGPWKFEFPEEKSFTEGK
jgi:hypothetical protein